MHLELFTLQQYLQAFTSPQLFLTAIWVSRYHNPDNYTKALGGVLRSRERPWRPALAGEVPSIGSTPSGGGGRPDFAVLRDVCGRER